jgi:hypothetical protein
VCSRRTECDSIEAPDSRRDIGFSTQPVPMVSGLRRKMPRVLMWAITEASSMPTKSPMVTRSGSVNIGSPPLGKRQTLFPILAPRARKYQTR